MLSNMLANLIPFVVILVPLFLAGIYVLRVPIKWFLIVSSIAVVAVLIIVNFKRLRADKWITPAR